MVAFRPCGNLFVMRTRGGGIYLYPSRSLTPARSAICGRPPLTKIRLHGGGRPPGAGRAAAAWPTKLHGGQRRARPFKNHFSKFQNTDPTAANTPRIYTYVRGGHTPRRSGGLGGLRQFRRFLGQKPGRTTAGGSPPLSVLSKCRAAAALLQLGIKNIG